jgi:hypothetical protein
MFNPLKPKRETERGESGGIAIDTTFNVEGGGHEFKFTATKVPRRCPLVLMVKVGSVRVRHLEVLHFSSLYFA